MSVSHALSAGQAVVPGGGDGHSAGEPGRASEGAVGGFAGAVLSLLSRLAHAFHSADVPTGVTLDFNGFVDGGHGGQLIKELQPFFGVDVHARQILHGQDVGSAGRLIRGHHGIAVFGGLAFRHIVSHFPIGISKGCCVHAVGGLFGVGHHVAAMSVEGFGDLGLDAILVGFKGVFDGIVIGQCQHGFDSIGHLFVRGFVALVGHDLLHAARDVAAGEIAVHHVSVARGHVVQGVHGHDLIPVTLSSVGFVVDDGAVQDHLQAVGSPVAPLMGVLLDVEAVFAVFQRITALAEVVKGSQIIGSKGDSHFLGSAGLKDAGLGVADQHHLGFFQTAALDAEVFGVSSKGSVHVQLHHVLARHVASVGDFHGDAVLAMGCQRHVRGGDFFREGGIGQAEAEGELHHLIIARGGAILEGQRLEFIGIEVANGIGSFVVAIAHIDAFLVLIEGLAVGIHITVVICVVVGGIGGHVIGEGVHQAAGGIITAGQQGGNARDACFAGMADPEASIHIVVFAVDEAQLHGSRAVDEDNGVGKVFFSKGQQVLFVLIQFQVGGAGQGAAVAVIVHGGRSAFRAGTGEGDDGVIGVAVLQNAALAALVYILGKFMDFGVAGPTAATPAVGGSGGRIVGVHAAFSAADFFQPAPGVFIHVQAGFQQRVQHEHGVFVVRAASGAGAAFHVVVAHRAQYSHFGAFCQGQQVVFILEEYRAFRADLHGHVIALRVAVIRVIGRGAGSRSDAEQHHHGNHSRQDFLAKLHIISSLHSWRVFLPTG